MTPSGTGSSSVAFAEGDPIPADAKEKSDALSREPVVLAVRDVPSAWLPSAIAELERLRELPPNWDSYGAQRVDRDSVLRATELLQCLARFIGTEAPTVTATPSGDAAFCWDAGAWSLDASVDPSGLISYVFLNEQDHSQDRDGRTRDAGTLAALLTSWP